MLRTHPTNKNPRCNPEGNKLHTLQRIFARDCFGKRKTKQCLNAIVRESSTAQPAERKNNIEGCVMAVGNQAIEQKGERAYKIGKRISECPYQGGCGYGVA